MLWKNEWISILHLCAKIVGFYLPKIPFKRFFISNLTDQLCASSQRFPALRSVGFFFAPVCSLHNNLFYCHLTPILQVLKKAHKCILKFLWCVCTCIYVLVLHIWIYSSLDRYLLNTNYVLSPGSGDAKLNELQLLLPELPKTEDSILVCVGQCDSCQHH